jgi:hypothetical protein
MAWLVLHPIFKLVTKAAAFLLPPETSVLFCSQLPCHMIKLHCSSVYFKLAIQYTCMEAVVIARRATRPAADHWLLAHFCGSSGVGSRDRAAASCGGTPTAVQPAEL